MKSEPVFSTNIVKNTYFYSVKQYYSTLCSNFILSYLFLKSNNAEQKNHGFIGKIFRSICFLLPELFLSNIDWNTEFNCYHNFFGFILFQPFRYLCFYAVGVILRVGTDDRKHLFYFRVWNSRLDFALRSRVTRASVRAERNDRLA